MNCLERKVIIQTLSSALPYMETGDIGRSLHTMYLLTKDWDDDELKNLANTAVNRFLNHPSHMQNSAIEQSIFMRFRDEYKKADAKGQMKEWLK